MQILKMCRKYLMEYKYKLILYIILSMIINIISISTPIFSGRFIDGLINIYDMKFVFNYSKILISLTLANITIGYVMHMVYLKLQINMGYKFNKNVIFYIQELPISYVLDKNMTYLNQIINEDTNSLIIFCIQVLQELLISIIVFPILIIICFRLNFYITIILMLFCIIYIVAYTLLRKSIYNISFTFIESKNEFFSKLFEQLEFVKFIKLNSIEDLFRERLIKPYDRLYKNTMKYHKFSYMFGSIDTIVSMLAQVSLYIMGAYQIMHGRFSIGSFVIFSSFFGKIISYIRYFFNFSKNYQDVLVSYNRINNILDETKENQGKTLLSNLNKIEIKDLSFRYGEQLILKNINCLFEKGNIYGIIGRNGSGKTTLINLMLGLYSEKISNGKILFDDIDIKKLDLKLLRSNIIGVSEQESTIINDNLYNNIYITSHNNDSSHLKLQDLSYILNLQEIIGEGKLNEDPIESSNFSGGESQKISILRTLLKDTDLIILDEPTSAIDKISATNLINYLKSIKKNKIIILITHDDSVIKECDEIIDLHKEGFTCFNNN